jgi:hypothetical protein
MVLLNFLLAIIVDAFSEVSNEVAAISCVSIHVLHDLMPGVKEQSSMIEFRL